MSDTKLVEVFSNNLYSITINSNVCVCVCAALHTMTISSSAHHTWQINVSDFHQYLGAEWRICGATYRRLIRGPRYEDPLVALCILGVEAVQDVAGLLLVQEGQQEVIVILFPALFWLPVGSQHQLLWKSDHLSSHTFTPRYAARALHTDTKPTTQRRGWSRFRQYTDNVAQNVSLSA